MTWAMVCVGGRASGGEVVRVEREWRVRLGLPMVDVSLVGGCECMR